MKTMLSRLINAVYRCALCLPVVGDALLIINSYTYEGSLKAKVELAPLSLWLKKHSSSYAIVIILMIISTPDKWFCGRLLAYLPELAAIEHKVSPGALILSIFPNMLGFGLGVYALIFGLSSILVKRIHESISSPKNGNSPTGSVLILNSDMAFPLLVMTCSLAIGVLQQIYAESNALELFAWAALWYSILMTFEILSALFGLGQNELLNKLND